MWAENSCGHVGPCMQSAALAYDPNDISSFVMYDHQKESIGVLGDSWQIAHRRINFADLNHCDTDRLSPASLTALIESEAGTYRCAPDIGVPTGLYRALPEWSTCIDMDPSDPYNIWDPPRVLHSVTALDAPGDKVTTASRHATASQTPSSAVTGPGLEVPLPETKRSTAMDDGTRSTVAADSHLQSSSAHDQIGDDQKYSDAVSGSSPPTGSRTAHISQTQVSFTSAESLPSVTAIFYTTHYLNTPTNSRSSASQENHDIVAMSSSSHPDPASNNADHSRSTVTSDPHNHPTQPQPSIITHLNSVIHPNDPTAASKPSLTTSFEASLAHHKSSLSF